MVFPGHTLRVITQELNPRSVSELCYELGQLDLARTSMKWSTTLPI